MHSRQEGESLQHNLQSALRVGLVSGTVASAVSTLALALCSKLEEGHAAGGINGPSQWIWGEAEAYTRRATLRHTAVGYAIHHVMSIFWATLHEAAFGRAANDAARAHPGRKSVQRICAEAAVTTAAAYVVDYHLTPRRLQPGFDKHLGALSMFVVYTAFGAGLAAAGIARRRSRDSLPTQR